MECRRRGERLSGCHYSCSPRGSPEGCCRTSSIRFSSVAPRASASLLNSSMLECELAREDGVRVFCGPYLIDMLRPPSARGVEVPPGRRHPHGDDLDCESRLADGPLMVGLRRHRRDGRRLSGDGPPMPGPLVPCLRPKVGSPSSSCGRGRPPAGDLAGCVLACILRPPVVHSLRDAQCGWRTWRTEPARVCHRREAEAAETAAGRPAALDDRSAGHAGPLAPSGVGRDGSTSSPLRSRERGRITRRREDPGVQQRLRRPQSSRRAGDQRANCPRCDSWWASPRAWRQYRASPSAARSVDGLDRLDPVRSRRAHSRRVRESGEPARAGECCHSPPELGRRAAGCQMVWVYTGSFRGVRDQSVTDHEGPIPAGVHHIRRVFGGIRRGCARLVRPLYHRTRCAGSCARARRPGPPWRSPGPQRAWASPGLLHQIPGDALALVRLDVDCRHVQEGEGVGPGRRRGRGRGDRACVSRPSTRSRSGPAT